LKSKSKNRDLLLMMIAFWAVAAWSAWRPHDYFTWSLEVFPAFAGFAALAFTYPRFRFTHLVYFLVLLHAIVLFVGGHYTYAEVPLFNWVRDEFHQARNNFDRVGHFMQGFVPAFIAREILWRRGIVQRRGWLRFMVIAICLAISAAYELFEWRVAVATGAASEAFLGSQGDPWDTQEDMATALVGASIAAFFFDGLHHRMMKRSS
jgi:putative membrane protein